MSALLVDVQTPALGTGRAARTYGIARALAASGGGLRMLYVPFGAPEPDAAFCAIPGLELIPVPRTRSYRRVGTYALALAQGVPRGFARGISAELADAARELAVEGEMVIADGPVAAATLSSLARRRAVIYNAHNLESGFRGALGRQEGGLRRLRAFERGVLERSAQSWMVSEADIAGARELCAGAQLRLVPNVVDVSAIEPVAQLAQQPQALFIGSFGYGPNRDALRYMLDEVMPLVWETRADARLLVAGGGLDTTMAVDERVRLLGFVDDLAALYGQAACALVPLRIGGGTPLKFIEALAYGLPVIATRRAAGGLAVRDGVDCILGDDGAQLAAGMLKALDGDLEAVARSGRMLALERYSIEALTRLLG